MRSTKAALVLSVACALAACGGSLQATPPARGGPPTLTLGATSARFEVHVSAGERSERARITLDVREVERGELLAWLQIVSVEPSVATPDAAGALGPLAGLAGVSFRWRMTRAGAIVAAGGPAAASNVPAETVARALELWPLISAAVPNLPDGPVSEGQRWDARQRTEVIGGGRERVVLVAGKWHLAKILAGSPLTVVLEGDLVVVVRDPTLAADEIEAKARSFSARAVVYVNLELHAVDFATVASEAFSWQVRRL